MCQFILLSVAVGLVLVVPFFVFDGFFHIFVSGMVFRANIFFGIGVMVGVICLIPGESWSSCSGAFFRIMFVIGFGFGFLSVLLPGYRVVLFDCSEVRLYDGIFVTAN